MKKLFCVLCKSACDREDKGIILKIEFGIGKKDITESSLREALYSIYGESEQMDPGKYLWLYQAVFTILRNDWSYMRDMKRVLVGKLILSKESEDDHTNDFIPLCGDLNVSQFYIKKHWDKLSIEAKELLNQHENDADKFLKPIELHLYIDYMADDDSF